LLYFSLSNIFIVRVLFLGARCFSPCI
jgi:hypothetical protein